MLKRRFPPMRRLVTSSISCTDDTATFHIFKLHFKSAWVRSKTFSLWLVARKPPDQQTDHLTALSQSHVLDFEWCKVSYTLFLMSTVINKSESYFDCCQHKVLRSVFSSGRTSIVVHLAALLDSVVLLFISVWTLNLHELISGVPSLGKKKDKIRDRNTLRWAVTQTQGCVISLSDLLVAELTYEQSRCWWPRTICGGWDLLNTSDRCWVATDWFQRAEAVITRPCSLYFITAHLRLGSEMLKFVCAREFVCIVRVCVCVFHMLICSEWCFLLCLCSFPKILNTV